MYSSSKYSHFLLACCGRDCDNKFTLCLFVVCHFQCMCAMRCVCLCVYGTHCFDIGTFGTFSRFSHILDTHVHTYTESAD